MEIRNKNILCILISMGLLLTYDLARAKSGMEICTVSDGGVPSGSVTFQVPVLEGFSLKVTRKGCNQFNGDDPKKSPLVVHVFAVTSGDAGPEQLLNQEPDGALLWLLKIAGPDAKRSSEGDMEIAGRKHRYFRVLGRPPGVDQIREIVVARVRKPKHNVVLLATYAPEVAGIWLNKALEVFAGTEILEIKSARDDKRVDCVSCTSSPEATFKTMLAAAKARDRSAFLACFAQGDTRRRMARALDEEPEAFWNKLEGVLRPPQELRIKKRSKDMIRGRVHAPNADGGGVGGLTFVRVGDEWKIKAW